MPKFINRNLVITVDNVDLSDHVSAVNIDQSSDDIDVTGFGAAAREHATGLSDASITLTFWQDFDAGSVDATLSPIHADPDTAVEVVVIPDGSTVSATNPSYTMQGILQNYTPLSGGVGEASSTEVTFQNADASGIVKATS